MLTFFPTLYPDELWYSALCRYQVRTGNTNTLLTKSGVDSNLLLPDSGIYETIKLLPQGVFDIEDIIINHTLFPYFCRMYPLEEKMEILKGLSIGVPMNPRWKNREKQTKTVLRYCPICKREEQLTYGESYWHREHQLPLMTVCPKHHCRLEEFVGEGYWKLKVFLPDFIEEEVDPSFEVASHEELLSNMLYRYLTVPIEMGPTDGYSNLQYEIKKKYQNILQGHIFLLDCEQLYSDLVSVYGTDIVKGYFGKKIRKTLPTQLQRWRFHAPEFYIILAGLMSQRPEVTFGPPLNENMLGNRIDGEEDIRMKVSDRKFA